MTKKLLEDTMMVVPKKVINEATGDGKWVAPIWNLDKLNLNGRVYSTTLAQRIVRENKVTGVCDGHEPDYHREYGNFIAVAKNPSIKEGQLWVEIEMINDEYGKHLERCMEKGLPIGVSSVGYGDCDQDGVVDANTYELVRYLDFVTSPAGEVYAKKEGKKPDQNQGPDSSMENQGKGAVAPEDLKKVEAYKKIEKILRRQNHDRT